jgi:hypothetical protein
MPACLPRALGGWPGYWLQIELILALLAAMGLPGLNVLAHSTKLALEGWQSGAIAVYAAHAHLRPGRKAIGASRSCP